eukprot:RCo004921
MTTVKMVSLPTSPLLSPERDSSDSSDSSGGYSAAAAMMDGACPPVLLLQSVLGIILASPKAVPESSLRRIDVMLSHLAAAVKKRIPGNGNGNGSHGGNGISKSLPTEGELTKAGRGTPSSDPARKKHDHSKPNGVLFPHLDTVPKGLLPHLPHPGPCHCGHSHASSPPPHPNSGHTTPTVDTTPTLTHLAPKAPVHQPPPPPLPQQRPPQAPPKPQMQHRGSTGGEPGNGTGGWLPLTHASLATLAAGGNGGSPPTTTTPAAAVAQ